MTQPAHNDIAIVLAAHGDRAGETPNATLLGHRDAIVGHGRFRAVTAGVLKGDPSLETALGEALESGASRIAVYPVFMAGGYFVHSVLPARVAAAIGADGRCAILPPLGRDPRVPLLLLSEALAAARLHGLDPATSRLLIVGHGSKLGPASAEATRAVARHVAEVNSFAGVATAFLEEAPFLDEALRDGTAPTIVAGFLYGDGLHGGEDVPREIEESGARAFYAGSLGRFRSIPELITDAVLAAIPG